MTTQLQKLWIFYYIPTHYISVLRSQHYYNSGCGRQFSTNSWSGSWIL